MSASGAKPAVISEELTPASGAKPAIFTGELTSTPNYLKSLDQLMKMRAESASRRNFAIRLVREIFTIEERKTSNVRGKKKNKLDEEKISYVRKTTFKLYPLDREVKLKVSHGDNALWLLMKLTDV